MSEVSKAVTTLSDGLNLTDAQKSLLTQNLSAYKAEKLLATEDDVDYAKKGSYMTASGLDILGKAAATKTISYSYVQLGTAVTSSGQIATPTHEQILAFTKLYKPMLRINIRAGDITFNGNGTASVRVVVDSNALKTQGLAQGFWCREVGLFAVDPDSGQTVLYSYKPYGALGFFIPGYDSATAVKVTVNLITVIDQATNITATIDGSSVSVTQAEFSDHRTSEDPHPNFLSKGAAVTTSTKFWASSEDEKVIQTISASNLKEQLLGGDINNLAEMSSRVSQTEMNIANLFLELNSIKDSGLEANLLLFEDFSESRFTDFFGVDVEEVFLGDTGACVSSIKGLLEGHTYIIKDNKNSQMVTVRSIGTNDGKLRVFFDEPLISNYGVGKTQLVRTKGVIEGNKLSGAGVEKEAMITLPYTKAFKGITASESYQATTEISLEKEENFTLSKNYDFTAAGQFTLKKG